MRLRHLACLAVIAILAGPQSFRDESEPAVKSRILGPEHFSIALSLQILGRQQANSGEAVANATLQQSRARRSKGISTHPSYWGSFLAVGDWR
jgi:hypothetical protein